MILYIVCNYYSKPWSFFDIHTMLIIIVVQHFTQMSDLACNYIDRELLKYSKHAAKEGRTEDTLTISMRFNLSILVVTVLLILFFLNIILL